MVAGGDAKAAARKAANLFDNLETQEVNADEFVRGGPKKEKPKLHPGQKKDKGGVMRGLNMDQVRAEMGLGRASTVASPGTVPGAAQQRAPKPAASHTTPGRQSVAVQGQLPAGIDAAQLEQLQQLAASAPNFAVEDSDGSEKKKPRKSVFNALGSKRLEGVTQRMSNVWSLATERFIQDVDGENDDKSSFALHPDLFWHYVAVLLVWTLLLVGTLSAFLLTLDHERLARRDPTSQALSVALHQDAEAQLANAWDVLRSARSLRAAPVLVSEPEPHAALLMYYEKCTFLAANGLSQRVMQNCAPSCPPCPEKCFVLDCSIDPECQGCSGCCTERCRGGRELPPTYAPAPPRSVNWTAVPPGTDRFVWTAVPSPCMVGRADWVDPAEEEMLRPMERVRAAQAAAAAAQQCALIEDAAQCEQEGCAAKPPGFVAFAEAELRLESGEVVVVKVSTANWHRLLPRGATARVSLGGRTLLGEREPPPKSVALGSADGTLAQGLEVQVLSPEVPRTMVFAGVVLSGYVGAALPPGALILVVLSKVLSAQLERLRLRYGDSDSE